MEGLLTNNVLDYVEFFALDQHWKGFVIDWNHEHETTIFVQEGNTQFRIRPLTEKIKTANYVIYEADVDLGRYSPEKSLSNWWESLSEPHKQDVVFFTKFKRWSYWVAVPIAIILYLIK
jgi:hypothetical protein